MLFTMLFEDSENELRERIRKKEEKASVGGDTVRKGPLFLAVLYPAVAAVLIALGTLMLVFRPIPQYPAAAICIFAASLVPLFFLVELLAFRIRIGNGKIALRKLASPEAVYSFADVAWKMQTPDKKRSAVILYVKGKQVARILPGAKNYAALTALRHKGPMKDGEKNILRTLDASKK